MASGPKRVRSDNAFPPRWFPHAALATMLLIPMVYIGAGFVARPNSNPLNDVVMMLQCIATFGFLVCNLDKKAKSPNERRITLEGHQGRLSFSVSGKIAAFLIVSISFTMLGIRLYREFSGAVHTQARAAITRANEIHREIIDFYYEDSFLCNENGIYEHGRLTHGAPAEEPFRKRRCDARIAEAERLRSELLGFRDISIFSSLAESALEQLGGDLAQLYLVKGELDNASKALGQLAAKDPQSLRRQGILKAKIQAAQGKLNEAESTLVRLVKELGEDRGLLMNLGTIRLRQAIARGAQIMPGGDPGQLDEEMKHTLDSAIDSFERAIIASHSYNDIPGPIAEHGPMISLALAKGLRRAPLSELHDFEPDFHHTFRMMDFVINKSNSLQSREWHLAKRLALVHVTLDLFERPISDEEYSQLLSLARHADSEESKAWCGTMLVQIMNTSIHISEKSGDLRGLASAIRRVEALLDEYGSFIRHLRPDDEIRCLEVLCLAANQECNHALQEVAKREPGSNPLSDSTLDRLFQGEKRLEGFMKWLQARGPTLDFYLLCGWIGQRKVLISTRTPIKDRRAIFEAGKKAISDAVRGASLILDPANKQPKALKVIDGFESFLKRIDDFEPVTTAAQDRNDRTKK